MNLQRDQLSQSIVNSTYPPQPMPPPQQPMTPRLNPNQVQNQPINVNPQNNQVPRHNDQMPEIRKYKKVQLSVFKQTGP